MEATNIIFTIFWIIMVIEIIILSIKAFKKRQLNHLPTHNHPFKEICFEITEIKSVSSGVIVEYTAVISFFKKANCKHFIYDEYKFYDEKDKYNIGDRLYLNKR